MKKVLGLDLGVASIGWAMIQEDAKNRNILGLGSRIIPLSADDKNEFSSGNKISKNQKRTTARTQRKGYDRYQLRRKYLLEFLRKSKLINEAEFPVYSKIQLWGLRSKAATSQIKLDELARILLHLNQKRGFKSSRSDANMDKKDTDYVTEVKNNFEKLKQSGQSIGEYFFQLLENDPNYRIKGIIFPREAYYNEFLQICKTQQKYYPETITEEFIRKVGNEIIYYQRPLKSQKGLVGTCEFEGFWTKDKKDRSVFAGPKVAHRSNPLFQISKIWESINSIAIKNRKGENYPISLEQKNKIFQELCFKDKITEARLFDLLGLSKKEGWFGNLQTKNGIQGNSTISMLIKACGDFTLDRSFLLPELGVSILPKETYHVDRKTGEVLNAQPLKVVDDSFERTGIYELWHIVYSIPEEFNCAKKIVEKFGFPMEVAERLARIDFGKLGFSNKSIKSIRKMLPYLMEGYVYSEAASYAGYNHSNSLTKGENLERILIQKLNLIPKNSLRQPIVEKILNQMINLVNALIEEYGNPDEIRIELARELKQSREEREKTFKKFNSIDRENKEIISRLEGEFGINATRNNIIKWRLFHEISGEESKANATCVYCGKTFGITDALKGTTVDVEHIIPKAKIFDDSQSNKTLAHRSCNLSKGDMTAYDFAKRTMSPEDFAQFLNRVEAIPSFGKRTKFLISYDDYLERKAKGKETPSDKRIWEDFIARQLNETRFIARKAKEILEQVSRNVWSTSGSVTSKLRYLWGWEDTLMNLQLQRFKDIPELVVTKIKKDDYGNEQAYTALKNWTKRDDHRHHALDALTIACTQQGFIQRINTLNAQETRLNMVNEVAGQSIKFKEKMSLLDTYLILQKPFSTSEVEKALASILVSFKSGKKVATFGKRFVKKNGTKELAQDKIIVPRGPLSEQSVYGKLTTLDRNLKTGEIIKRNLKYLFENPDLIFKEKIRDLVKQRLAEFEGNAKKALSSTAKTPIFLDNDKQKPLEYATCLKEETVIRYPLNTLKAKDVVYIVDEKVRQLVGQRFKEFEGKEKQAFNTPLWYDESRKIPIRNVRLFTELKMVRPIRKSAIVEPVSYVAEGNNHHIAIYMDLEGNLIESVSSFWHVVDRKRFGLPAIIKNPLEVWDAINASGKDLPQEFLQKLPDPQWKFFESLQQNEMFLMGLKKEAAEEAIHEGNFALLSNYLYRVQKISSSDYYFRHHLETSVENLEQNNFSEKFLRIRSFGALVKNTPIKARINLLGKIVLEN